MLAVGLSALVMLGGMELLLRGPRHAPIGNGFKLGPEWGAQIAEATAGGDDSIVVIGDSRVSWGVDCIALEEGIGDPSLRCTNAGVVWGYLPDLLPILIERNLRPRIMLVALSAATLHSPVFRQKFRDVEQSAQFHSAINRLETKIRYVMRQSLAIGATETKTTIKRALGVYRPPFDWEDHMTFHQTWQGWNRYRIDPAYRPAVADFQWRAYNEQFLKDVSSADRDLNEASVIAALHTLAQRVPHLVLFRMPMDDRVAKAEEDALDMTRRLDAFVSKTGLPYRDFDREPMGEEPYPVSDGSHMEEHEAPRFGRDLGRWVSSVVGRSGRTN